VHYQFVPRHVHLQGLRQPFPELREHAHDTGQMLLLYCLVSELMPALLAAPALHFPVISYPLALLLKIKQ
jgi:hypothetical protein